MALDNNAVHRLLKYLQNSLLVLSVIFGAIGLYFNGFSTFGDVKFWVIVIALWQAVIMLMIVEHFDFPKKSSK